MRKYAYLKEPLQRDQGNVVYKIMLYSCEEGVYLFEYFSPEAVLSSSDLFYDSEEDLHDDWDERIDERGWIEMEDPLPDCQQDAFVPLRVKGRNIGRPEWGHFETLTEEGWIEYRPADPAGHD